MMKTLLLVMDESSSRILGAALVPKNEAGHEFSRLIDHFQFGSSDWDRLTPIAQTFAIRIKPVLSVTPASNDTVTIEAPSFSRFLS